METQDWIWIILVVIVILQFTGKVNFLGATEGGDWSDIGDTAMDALKNAVDTLVSWAKDNAIVAGGLVVALFFILSKKR